MQFATSSHSDFQRLAVPTHVIAAVAKKQRQTSARSLAQVHPITCESILEVIRTFLFPTLVLNVPCVLTVYSPFPNPVVSYLFCQWWEQRSATVAFVPAQRKHSRSHFAQYRTVLPGAQCTPRTKEKGQREQDAGAPTRRQANRATVGSSQLCS